ncbi:PadR family transcriptional regulator, partial [Phytoactinopolyspora endophytica]|uniref:PadR family transcriptional regulator n=1 Tax=Phytoactinopolyspora endophytica TaxID=1642495 RepID=UPI00197B7004
MKFDDVLLALTVRRPLTGYDLKRWLDIEGVFIRANADQSQIYRTLHRLARARLIEYHEEERANAPKAKVYTATPDGVAHLHDLAHGRYQPPARWQEPDFMSRYTLLGTLWPETLAPLIET